MKKTSRTARIDTIVWQPVTQHSRKLAATAALALSLLISGLASNARADEQDRVAIESFRGPHAQRLQGAVETGLVSRYYVVPDFSIEDMARRRGVALAHPAGMAEVGRALQVRAFLSAQVEKRGGLHHVRMIVRRGDTGQALGRFVVSNRRLDHLESTLAARTSRRIGALLARTSMAEVPASAQPESADSAGPALEPAAPAEATPALKRVAPPPLQEARLSERRGEVIELSVGSRLFNRSFEHSQNLSGLSDYALEGALATALAARVHPFAFLAPGLADLGLDGALEYGLGVTSRVAGSETRAPTDVNGYALGLSYRVRLGDTLVEPGLHYTSSVFNAADTPAPSARYLSVAPGLGLHHAPHARVGLDLGVRYLHVLSAGGVTDADRFPRATVNGLEATASVAFALAGPIDVVASAGLRRFGITTHVVPGDRIIAGGAVDQTSWLGLGLAYRPTLAGAR